MLWRSRDEAKRLARNAATAQAQHKQTGGGENSGELLSECRRCKACARTTSAGKLNLSGKRTER